MHVHLPRIDIKALQNTQSGSDTSEVIRARVTRVRERQQRKRGKINSELINQDIEKYCNLNTELLDFLAAVCEKLNLSARAYHRVLKLARTIADMSNEEQIAKKHLLEAVSFRSLDRR